MPIPPRRTGPAATSAASTSTPNFLTSSQPSVPRPTARPTANNSPNRPPPRAAHQTLPTNLERGVSTPARQQHDHSSSANDHGAASVSPTANNHNRRRLTTGELSSSTTQVLLKLFAWSMGKRQMQQESRSSNSSRSRMLFLGASQFPIRFRMWSHETIELVCARSMTLAQIKKQVLEKRDNGRADPDALLALQLKHVPIGCDWSPEALAALAPIDERSTLESVRSIAAERLRNLTPTMLVERVPFTEPRITDDVHNEIEGMTRSLITTHKMPWKDTPSEAYADEVQYFRRCMAKLRADERRMRQSGELHYEIQRRATVDLQNLPTSAEQLLIDVRMPLTASKANVFKVASRDESADAFLLRCFKKHYERVMPQRSAYDFALKRTGVGEYLTGSAPMLSFDYVRRCVLGGQRADFTVVERAAVPELRSPREPLAESHTYAELAEDGGWRIEHRDVSIGAVAWHHLTSLSIFDMREQRLRVRVVGVERLNSSLLQLVQVLKYEPYHDSALARFLLRRALGNRVVGHHLFWFLRSEMHVSDISRRFGLLLEAYLRGAGSALHSLQRQSELIAALTAAAERIKPMKDAERLAQLRGDLQRVSDTLLAREPIDSTLDPRTRLGALRVDKCKYMDSKKLPLWLVFTNASGGDDVYIIFKAGDDLRQDMLTLQMIRLMDKLWSGDNLDLQMSPYGCVATGDEIGMIEVVLNSETTAKITAAAGGVTAAFRSDPLLKWMEAAAARSRWRCGS
jgi:hypothetical protein